MAVSITCYVAAEAGISDWLVRYLASLPMTEASLALTLFWAESPSDDWSSRGSATGSIPSGALPRLAVAGGVLLAVALVLPISSVSPLLFGAVGLAFGPIFPLMVAAAGARMPGESATVTGTLVFAGGRGCGGIPRRRSGSCRMPSGCTRR